MAPGSLDTQRHANCHPRVAVATIGRFIECAATMPVLSTTPRAAVGDGRRRYERWQGAFASIGSPPWDPRARFVRAAFVMSTLTYTPSSIGVGPTLMKADFKPRRSVALCETLQRTPGAHHACVLLRRCRTIYNRLQWPWMARACIWAGLLWSGKA